MDADTLNLVQRVLDWRSWDYLAVFYGVLATLVVTVGTILLGLPKRASSRVKRWRAEKNFRRQTIAACERATVVGRREGFKLSDVYVPLDLAPSELVPEPESPYGPFAFQERFVLLGGPGAGKSTWAKNMVLDWRSGRAFFTKLRDLPSNMEIVEYLATKAEAAGIPESAKWVESQLQNRTTLVVLDGLDEVRAADFAAVSARINDFYKRYAYPRSGCSLVVTCRKEAFRNIPLEIPTVLEVRPLTDEQIERFARKWPPGYPEEKSALTFFRELKSSERILEIARSPLMLVGALVQYTESNLGIPDERKDYLARISQWLIRDWARAQRHPTDEWQRAYEPVLTKLAFAMHELQTAEISREDGTLIIRDTLPKVGLDGGKTEAFIEGLVTKTGILVRDTPGAFVFAQFTLQEFFAAKEAAAALSPHDLANLPMDWWREAVILAVALQQRPDGYFTALFDKDPLLGVSAVAEYPTPALVFQGRAVSEALAAIDGKAATATEAIITLARKVEGRHERNLIEGLEARLQSGDEAVAAEAGRILALAGTPDANMTLAKYPSTWQQTLKRAGYFSASFENLLVKRIKGDNPTEAEAALNVVLGRLSDDRRDELINALDSLPAQRARAVAEGLLDSFQDRQVAIRWNANRDLLRVACYCAPHMEGGYPGSGAYRVPEGAAGLIARVAGELQRSRKKSPGEAYDIFLLASDWVAGRNVLLWTLASFLVMVVLGVPAGYTWLVLVLAFLAAFSGALVTSRLMPWFPVKTEAGFQTAVAIVVGGLGVAVFTDSFTLNPLETFVSLVPVLALAMALMAGLHLRSVVRPRLSRKPFAWSGRILFGWTGFVIAMSGLWFVMPSLSSLIVLIVAGGFAAAAFGTLIWFAQAARLVRSARRKVFEEEVYVVR